MSILVQSLDELNGQDVRNNLSLLQSFLQSSIQNVDLSSGAVRDLVLYLHAVLSTKTSEEIVRYLSAQSLQAITESPESADEGVVDRILSNYNVVRRGAGYASGRILLRYARDLPVLIPQSTKFSFGSDVYVSEEGVVVGSTSSASPDHLTRQEDGTFTYILPVSASEAGASVQILKGTKCSTSLEDILEAVAYEDFRVGTPEETNRELIARLADGMATPCWGNRHQIMSLIQSRVPETQNISVIGFGDPEMQRDRLTIFPVSVGGKADIYVKTASETRTVNLDCTFTGMSGIYEKWEVTIPQTVFPAAYRVLSAEKNGASYAISGQTLVSGIGFTAEQQLHAEFLVDDVSADRAVGDTETFAITLIGQTAVQGIHDLFQDPYLMPVTEDALVRSANPVWVDVTLSLTSQADNETEIKKAVTSAINATGFDGKLPASEITRAILPVLSGNQYLLSLHMASETWGPNGEVYRGSAVQTLYTPDDLESAVTANTSVFYARNIQINY